MEGLVGKPTTLPTIQVPVEAIDHVPVRASMLWLQFSPDGAKHDVVGYSGGGSEVTKQPRCAAMVSALHLCLHSETVLPGSTRFDRRDVQHGAHMQKSAPQPKKPWTSQQTAAMSVWTGTARHQLHKHRLTLERADAKQRGFLRKGAEARALLTLKVQRAAMKRAITRDLTALLEKLVSEANDAAGICRHKKTETWTRQTPQSHQRRERSAAGGRRAGRRQMETPLGGVAARTGNLIVSAHEKQHAGRGRMNLEKGHPRKATGPSGAGWRRKQPHEHNNKGDRSVQAVSKHRTTSSPTCRKDCAIGATQAPANDVYVDHSLTPSMSTENPQGAPCMRSRRPRWARTRAPRNHHRTQRTHRNTIQKC